MLHIKSAFGILLVVVALYFLGTTFSWLGKIASPRPAFLALSAGMVLLGLALGAVHGQVSSERLAPKLRKAAGVLLTSAGAFLLITGALRPTQSLSWESIRLSEARLKAKSQKRPLLVDFTADWCIACKELDKVTFADQKVIDEGGRFVAVKIDATDDEDPKAAAAMRELKVRGLPTLAVFDSSGREVARFTDFVGPEQLARVLAGTE
jgi:thiol:disulfide interchange protein DsbD